MHIFISPMVVVHLSKFPDQGKYLYSHKLPQVLLSSQQSCRLDTVSHVVTQVVLKEETNGYPSHIPRGY